jgi:hypothetical protein
MWALLFEVLREHASRDNTAAVVRDAPISSDVAAFVDYVLAPHRFTPGWELLVSSRSELQQITQMLQDTATKVNWIEKQPEPQAASSANLVRH